MKFRNIEGSCYSFNLWFETATTAKAGPLEPQSRHVIGREADSKCVLQRKLLLLNVFACQVLNIVSEILENEEVQDLSKAYLKTVKQPSALPQRNVWRALKELPMAKSFPDHITLYLS